MIRTTLNWTVKNLKAMRDEKETLSFNHPIQRQSAQWTNEQQSLLIHSMLDNFPVPSVYIHKTESVEVDAKGRHSYGYSVLDGKQRMTTVFSYIDGEFALADDTPDVTIEDTVYEIAGKYYDDLDEEVQKEILYFKFNIQAFEDVTDEVIEEIFFRLNNSTPLTKPQKAKPLMGVGNSIFINEILENRFFKEKCSFTKRQLMQSADLCTLLQGMMLLDNKYRGYDFPNISDDEAMVYSKWINGNYPEEYRCRIKKIVAFLDNIFYMKEKNLKKINIPILFLMADKALSLSISGTNFRRWFYNFFDNHKEEYGQYCSSGSVKKEKTLGRIEVMEKYFDDYFRTDVEGATEQEETVENEVLELTESTEQEATTTEDESEQKSPDTEQEEASSDESTAEQNDNVSDKSSDVEDLSDKQGNADNASNESYGQEISDAEQDDSANNEADSEQNISEQDNDESVENDYTDNEDSFPDDTDDNADTNADEESNGSNGIDTESSPVSEDAYSKVSSSHVEAESNNSFFSSVARFWNKDKVLV